VAVNPDRVLLLVARERGWEVRYFVLPVRLRDRVPAPPIRATAIVGASAAMVVAGALLVRRSRRAAPVSLPSASLPRTA
jgi:hypothetical protein